jgi:hypothetical protein
LPERPEGCFAQRELSPFFDAVCIIAHMAKKSPKTHRKQLAVDVDACRVRLQTGKPVIFVDARRPEDWAAGELKITGAVRLAAESTPVHLPCPKHCYMVVYCA